MTQRRLRTRRAVDTSAPAVSTGLVDGIGTLQAHIAELQAELSEKMSQLASELPQGKTFTDGEYQAVWQEQKGRSTSEIDTAKYKELVSEDDFTASVTVTKKEASKFVTGAQLEKITTVTPPAPKPPKLAVVPRG